MIPIPEPILSIEDFLGEIDSQEQNDLLVIWEPQIGSQVKFLSCPVWEVLYHGTRGPGKTDALLMDFAQHCGQGYGMDWRGILFRRTFPELQEVIVKAQKWFKRVFPEAEYNSGQHMWAWPDGEQLLFRYMRNIDDYWSYHGHEYPWIGWEELCTWPNLDPYHRMKACNRSSNPDVPRRYRATANPYGPGHTEVKAYFIDVAPEDTIYTDKETNKQRCHIKGFLVENKVLLSADPGYMDTLLSMCKNDPNLKKAWIEGSWDIVAGGALTDVWYPDVHVVKPFPVPASWRIDRAYDWGSSKPYAIGFFAEADGEFFLGPDNEKMWVPKGTVFMIGELYGWGGKPNAGTRELPRAIAADVVQWESGLRVARYSRIGGKRFKYDTKRIKKSLQIETMVPARVKPGPADPSIFDTSTGESIAEKMSKAGVSWKAGDKSPGSRVAGLETIRERLHASLQKPMEAPGFFIFNTCRHWIRTCPSLPRDEKKLDDVDTEAEDHMFDMTRYRLERKKFTTISQEA